MTPSSALSNTKRRVYSTSCMAFIFLVVAILNDVTKVVSDDVTPEIEYYDESTNITIRNGRLTTLPIYDYFDENSTKSVATLTAKRDDERSETSDQVSTMTTYQVSTVATGNISNVTTVRTSTVTTIKGPTATSDVLTVATSKASITTDDASAVTTDAVITATKHNASTNHASAATTEKDSTTVSLRRANQHMTINQPDNLTTLITVITTEATLTATSESANSPPIKPVTEYNTAPTPDSTKDLSLPGRDYCSFECSSSQGGKTDKHLMCEYAQGTLGSMCSEYGAKELPLSLKKKKALVHEHNVLRSKVALGKESRGRPGPQPPAAKMVVMTWDDELEAIARRWAMQCEIDDEKEICRDLWEYKVGLNVLLDCPDTDTTTPEENSATTTESEEIITTPVDIGSTSPVENAVTTTESEEIITTQVGIGSTKAEENAATTTERKAIITTPVGMGSTKAEENAATTTERKAIITTPVGIGPTKAEENAATTTESEAIITTPVGIGSTTPAENAATTTESTPITTTPVKIPSTTRKKYVHYTEYPEEESIALDMARWYNEVKKVKPLSTYPNDSNSRDTRHYKQMVGAITTKMGCARMLMTLPDQCYFLVCMYAPAVELEEPPYEVGVPCHSCEKGCSNNFPGLCKITGEGRDPELGPARDLRWGVDDRHRTSGVDLCAPSGLVVIFMVIAMQ